MESPPWPPPGADAAAHPLARTGRRDDGAILAGVARDLGLRTGVDPLWFRIGFVVLAVFSGLGVVLYGGVWLILRGRRQSPFGPLVVAGCAVIVVGCVALLGVIGTSYINSPWTIVFVLAGVSVALWQPRDLAASGTAAAVGGFPAPPAPAAMVREPRPPSALGRWTLASALIVGAAGAIAYQLDGDGLHPERWLGASAAICGVGIVVGAWRGRALWLVVPALVFAASGFVAGHAARAGIDGFDAGAPHFWVEPMRPFGLPDREDLIAGEIEVTLYSAPPAGTSPDLRVGLGVIDIVVDDDVTIDVRAHVHDGDIIIDGKTRANDGEAQVIRIGPGDSADAVISATVSIGRLEITQLALADRAGLPGDVRSEG